MSPEQISYLSLLVALISLIISFVTLYRDRHYLKVNGAIYQHSAMGGKYSVMVKAANAGRRPISVSFITVRTKNSPAFSTTFCSKGENSVTIDVGNSATASVHGPTSSSHWQTPEEIKRCKFYVQDAIGKEHRVKFA